MFDWFGKFADWFLRVENPPEPVKPDPPKTVPTNVSPRYSGPEGWSVVNFKPHISSYSYPSDLYRGWKYYLRDPQGQWVVVTRIRGVRVVEQKEQALDFVYAESEVQAFENIRSDIRDALEMQRIRDMPGRNYTL